VASLFGESFAKQISVMEPGRWQGPISSSFGQHFVNIGERISGILPPLDAVRETVRREWSNARRLEAEQKLYGSLRERYEIVVETQPAKSAQIEANR
jgi:parvulin-like peptidyl-prolyl isomerase